MENKVSSAKIGRRMNSLTFKYYNVEGTTITACWAFLPNGFCVAYGESSCVDPANFDKENGETYALERCLESAENKLWELEGYLLKASLTK